jgi:hypothetical protein
METQAIVIDGRAVPVWPPAQTLVTKGGPMVHATRFEDGDVYHAGLRDSLLAMAADPANTRRYFRGACGTKIHHLATWGLPAADLLDARARAMFMHALGKDTAVVDHSWANIYSRGDYCMPHSHVRGTASVVYMLEAGDEDPDDPHAGRLCIVDPRIPACCGEQRACMTTPFLPSMTPGTMLIFPSQTVHCVNPYTGSRPRITLSWNINAHAVPGRPRT